MESNPAYGFVQENISSHLPAIENTYEQVQRPHTIEVSADKKITARNNETLKLKVRKIADKSIVGVVAAIVAVLALVIAIVAIIVAETDHSNPEIQSRVEIENLREMLNGELKYYTRNKCSIILLYDNSFAIKVIPLCTVDFV